MINEITSDVVTLYESFRVPGGCLDGFKTILGDTTNVMTDHHPALQIEHNGTVSLRPLGNGWELKIGFWATAYSSSIEGQAAGRRAHSSLIADFKNGKLQGLVPASAYLQGFTSNSGVSFEIIIDESTEPLEVKGKNHQHWTFVTAQTLTFRTILNKSQLRSTT